MTALRPDIDPDGLLEYSVVFTDRSLNHMSLAFQQVMREIHATLCEVYGAPRAVVVPGGGTYAMEAVARQLATGKTALVIRNGFFSYRWSQIFEAGAIPAQEIVMKARRAGEGPQAPFAPAPIEEVTEAIRTERPAVVFAPHVETASGMILPDDYVRAVAGAAHEVGALFVLDCIASGCVWVNMAETGVDVLISAPQKGWSGPPCAGLVMLNDTALERCKAAQSTSFAMDLMKWNAIMEAYLNGGHAYHATMPTDALRAFHHAMMETRAFGFERARAAQWE
jgi:aspartate aminotransferase-like enzyme